jgi:anti-anti-sigma regulatory factor
MKYKIDTKEHFDIITPLCAQFDSILSDQLNELVDDSRENARSLLIDFSQIETMTDENVRLLEALHNEMYNDNLSFILCHMHISCKKTVAENELEHLLNMVPTMNEALDMINMEGLERELLNEE